MPRLAPLKKKITDENVRKKLKISSRLKVKFQGIFQLNIRKQLDFVDTDSWVWFLRDVNSSLQHFGHLFYWAPKIDLEEKYELTPDGVEMLLDIQREIDERTNILKTYESKQHSSEKIRLCIAFIRDNIGILSGNITNCIEIKDEDPDRDQIFNLCLKSIVELTYLILQFSEMLRHNDFSETKIAQFIAPTPMPTGNDPENPDDPPLDLTARGTPRKIAPKRSVDDLRRPELGFDHPDNKIQAHFQSKADKEIVERFNEFCKSNKGLKQDYTTEALRDFLEKYDPHND